MLPKKEKTWFFLLWIYQRKINPLILLVFIWRYTFNLSRLRVCCQSESTRWRGFPVSNGQKTYSTPWPSIASATFTKPAIFAPRT
ncbi:hypothetical protein E2L00_08190 [Cedecea colo]|uniref:Secreted protein n=1 Tax=Cedecea colo TaxID=2552946 RepID=A0ABX0VKD1_9ENTR|nr:hypothetical protein [Cedecea colo]